MYDIILDTGSIGTGKWIH